MINNNITEGYCSFEVSKLLKEKGFDVESDRHYGFYPKRVEGAGWHEPYTEAATEIMWKPTHALAIKWIRENFGIHIYISTLRPKEWHFSYRILTGEEYELKYGGAQYSSPEEATEAALLYTLQNLIP